MIGPERPHAGRLAALIPLLALVFPGCGPGDSGPAVHPVSGSVFVDGRPAPGVEIVFHPDRPTSDPANTAIAVSAPDGRFQPSTRLANDGLPAGDYQITATWREVKVVGGEEIQGVDRLHGRYGDPRTSTLRATIREGDNVLPRIDLRSTAKPPSSPR